MCPVRPMRAAVTTMGPPAAQVIITVLIQIICRVRIFMPEDGNLMRFLGFIILVDALIDSTSVRMPKCQIVIIVFFFGMRMGVRVIGVGIRQQLVFALVFQGFCRGNFIFAERAEPAFLFSGDSVLVAFGQLRSELGLRRGGIGLFWILILLLFGLVRRTD